MSHHWPNLSKAPDGRVGANGTPPLPAGSDWVSCLAGCGEMGDRIRSFDWSSTPLGPIGRWPSSLREAIRLCLLSRFQLAVYWGPQLILLYNDAEREVLGTMHPGVLGQPASELLADNWDVLGPMLQGVLERGEATWSIDQALRLNRRGVVEESFFTYSYSPIPNEDGIGGVLLVSFETTERVLTERRLRTLRELAAATADATSVYDVCIRTAAVLGFNPHDIPFCILFLNDSDGRPRLCSYSGVQRDPDSDRWPLQEAESTLQTHRVDDVAARLPQETAALPRSALVLPIVRPGNTETHGCLVAGLSDVRLLDEPFREFLNLVVGQIATAIAGRQAEDAVKNAHTELERRVLERTQELFRSNAHLGRQVARRMRVEAARTKLLRRLTHGQEEEHRRIARELHDDMTQRLALLAINAGKVELEPDRPEEVRDQARFIREQLVSLSEAVHSLSRQLHPAILDDLGLVDALGAECVSLGQRDGIAVKYLAKEVPSDLPRDVALCAYRVAQEALRNVARHAGCTRASVRLVGDGRELVLCVRDRGGGFEAALRGRKGLGLQSMRERARLIQALLTVRSKPGVGTKVTLRIPLSRC